MNTNKRNTCVALVVAMMALGLDAAEKEAVIALSPFLPEAEMKDTKKQLLEYILVTAETGEQIDVIDGWEATLIASFTIPELKLDSIRARQKAMARPLGELLSWFVKDRSDYILPEGSGALDTPSLVSAIRRRGVSVALLIGSPVYRDPVDPKHSWRVEIGDRKGYWFPSDGSFFANGISPWAIGSGQDLERVSLRWLLKGDCSFPNGAYEDRVRRFLSLYFEQEGGTLMSFHADGRQVFEDLHREGRPPFEYELGSDRSRLQMLRESSEIEFYEEELEPEEREEKPKSEDCGKVPEEQKSEAPAPNESDVLTPVSVAVPISTDLATFAKDRVIVVDMSDSMSGVRNKVASEIAAMDKIGKTLLLSFHQKNGRGEVIADGEDPALLAEAMLSAEGFHGLDHPGSMASVIRAVRIELRALGASEGVDIFIYTDVAPVKTKGIDCGEELEALVKAGHRVRIVKCSSFSDENWIPEGAIVTTLEEVE